MTTNQNDNKTPNSIDENVSSNPFDEMSNMTDDNPFGSNDENVSSNPFDEMSIGNDNGSNNGSIGSNVTENNTNGRSLFDQHYIDINPPLFLNSPKPIDKNTYDFFDIRETNNKEISDNNFAEPFSEESKMNISQTNPFDLWMDVK